MMSQATDQNRPSIFPCKTRIFRDNWKTNIDIIIQLSVHMDNKIANMALSIAMVYASDDISGS